MERLVLEASSSGRPWLDAVRVPGRGFPQLSRAINPHMRLAFQRIPIGSAPKGVVDIVTSPEQNYGMANGSAEPLQHGTSTTDFGTHLIVERQEEKRVTTFRFPAALVADEQTVSVSGAHMFGFFPGLTFCSPLELVGATLN